MDTLTLSPTQANSIPPTKKRRWNKLASSFAQANVTINGSRPWDIQVHDPRFYNRILAEGSLGLAESYIDGWWDCDALDELFTRLAKHKLSGKVKAMVHYWDIAVAYFVNLQKGDRAYTIGQKHYDIGNGLFDKMLGKHAVYSCGYWKNAQTLDEAQRAKIDLVCRKLDLQPGMKVLDIGCGWGEACRYAAEHYGVEITGMTVSEEQVRYGKELNKGLPVDIKYQDYREATGSYDRIFSIGMFEHVGPKNYRTFFEKSKSLLKPKGRLLLHTIGANKTTANSDPFITRYIFTNSKLPSPRQIIENSEDLFVMEDWHNFGPDYDKTLMAWHKNFEQAWPDLAEKYGERFYRMWRYYLLYCAGGFRARQIQLWQILLSPQGLDGRYDAPR